jgi:hypothetical protein
MKLRVSCSVRLAEHGQRWLWAEFANLYTSVSTDWQVVSIGDYNGDYRDDVMWRNVDGRITNWLGTMTGGLADNIANAYNGVDVHWLVQPEQLWG